MAKQRLNLELPKRTMAVLDLTRERMGSASRTETIRRAIALMDVVSQHLAQCGKVVLKGPDGEEEVVRIVY